jgi:chromosome segregation ATPase
MKTLITTALILLTTIVHSTPASQHNEIDKLETTRHNEITTANTKITSLKENIKAIDESLANEVKNSSELSTRISHLSDSVDELTTKSEDLMAQKAIIEEKSIVNTERLEKSITSITTLLNTQSAKNAQLISKVSVLKNTAKTQLTELATQQKEINKSKSTIKTNLSDIVTLNSNIIKLNSQLTKELTNSKSLNNTISDLSSEKEALFTSNKTKIEMLLAESNTLEDKLSNKKLDIEKTTKILTNTKVRLDDSEKSLSMAKTSIINLESKINNLLDSNINLKNQLSTEIDSNTNTKAINISKINNLLKLQNINAHSINELTTNLNSKKDKIYNFEKIIAVLNKEALVAQSKKENLLKELQELKQLSVKRLEQLKKQTNTHSKITLDLQKDLDDKKLQLDSSNKKNSAVSEKLEKLSLTHKSLNKKFHQAKLAITNAQLNDDKKSSEISALTAKLNSTSKKVLILSNEIKDLSLLQNVDYISKEIIKHRAELKNRDESLSTTKDFFGGMLDELNSKNASAQSEIDEYSKKLSNQSNELKATKDKLSKVTSSKAAMNMNLSSKVSELQSLIKILELENKGRESLIRTLESDINNYLVTAKQISLNNTQTLKNLSNESSSDLTKLTNKLTTEVNKQQALAQEIITLKKNTNKLESNVDSLSASLDANITLKKKDRDIIANLQNEIANLNAHTTSSKKSLTASIQDLNQKNTSLEKIVANKDKSTKLLLSEIANLKIKFNKDMANMEDTSDTKEKSLLANISSNLTKIDILEKTLLDLNALNLSKDALLDKITIKIGKLKTQKTKVEDMLSTNNDSITDLNKTITKLKISLIEVEDKEKRAIILSENFSNKIKSLESLISLKDRSNEVTISQNKLSLASLRLTLTDQNEKLSETIFNSDKTKLALREEIVNLNELLSEKNLETDRLNSIIKQTTPTAHHTGNIIKLIDVIMSEDTSYLPGTLVNSFATHQSKFSPNPRFLPEGKQPTTPNLITSVINYQEKINAILKNSNEIANNYNEISRQNIELSLILEKKISDIHDLKSINTSNSEEIDKMLEINHTTNVKVDLLSVVVGKQANKIDTSESNFKTKFQTLIQEFNYEEAKLIYISSKTEMNLLFREIKDHDLFFKFIDGYSRNIAIPENYKKLNDKMLTNNSINYGIMVIQDKANLKALIHSVRLANIDPRTKSVFIVRILMKANEYTEALIEYQNIMKPTATEELMIEEIKNMLKAYEFYSKGIN